MKKYFFGLFLLFLLFSSKAEAFNVVATRTSVPSGSQYSPRMSYGFNINIDDVSSPTNVYFEWNGLYNNSSSCTSTCDVWFYESDLAAGSYNYRWIIENASDSLTLSNTYIVAKNSSSIKLTLDGTEGNKSYSRYTIANIVARLPAPKTIKLESTYPGWTTQFNMSIIQNSTNLTENGIFSFTASWNGDENYTSSSETFYLDSGPPQFSDLSTTPSGIAGYVPDADYKFRVTVKDLALTSVWFESNFTGTMKTYDAASDPQLINSSGTFEITLSDLGARNFSYRWHAKNGLNDESSTDFINYIIAKMDPLIMNILPSTNLVDGGQVTADCHSITPEINVSKFGFYKGSELIGNASYSTRMGTFLLSVGKYNFTCNTSGTENYTNQTITRTVTVSATPPKQENVTGELEITNTNFPSIETGKTGTGSFDLKNGMSKNIFNISVSFTGIPSAWFSIIKPSYIYSSETKEVAINFDIPSDAETKVYSVLINVNGNTSDGKLVSATKDIFIEITGVPENQPPSLAGGNVNRTGEDLIFSLGWYDDNGLSGYIFSSNISGQWENDSWIPLEGKNGLISISKVLNSNSISVAWKIYANDTNNKWTTSDEYTAKIETAPPENSNIIFIIAFIVAVIIISIFIISRKLGKKEKKIEYVFKKEDLDDKKH